MTKPLWNTPGEPREGWGRVERMRAQVVTPRPAQPVAESLAGAPGPVIPAGLGRAYGDAALAPTVLDLRDRDMVTRFDRATGELTAGAGLSLGDLLRFVIPAGWFPPVLPGTRHVTLGGAFAADIHGKNHHGAGSFARHVKRIRVLRADGEVTEAVPDGKSTALFHATAGGMGLTGPILDLTLQLQRVETASMQVRHQRVASLSTLMYRLDDADREWPYTVAWLDAYGSGPELGRGEVILGRHADREDLPAMQRGQALTYDPCPPVSVPIVPPLNVVQRRLVQAYNAWRYGQCSLREGLEPVAPFFFPLDALGHWNRLYGPPGFHQYQFVVPFHAGEAVIRKFLRVCQRTGLMPSLVVLKRFGDASPGPLSFPMPGWTLAADFPADQRLFPLFERMDDLVLRHGGRVYLAKDDRLRPATFRAMYPRYRDWLTVKRDLDTDGRWASALSARLHIDDDLRRGR